MQSDSHTAFDPACDFCTLTTINPYILKETAAFRLIADHAPLVEGHILLLPKEHFACYGAVPATLDEELFALKAEAQRFLTHYYAPSVFWEHGIFRQTVFHAHLHCFPFGEITATVPQANASQEVHTQEDIRQWYSNQGQYFYLESGNHAWLFTPEMERYVSILRGVFGPGILARGGNVAMRSPQQRYEEGGPLIASLKEKWHTFQQQQE